MMSIRNLLVLLVASATMIFAASGASANVLPTLDTTYSHGSPDIFQGPSGTTIAVTGVTGDPSLGAHADLNVDMSFSYGATGFTNGVEDPDTYPAGTDYRETVKSLVVETPPGLIGNPNAIPYDERCDPSTFETGECPDSATVGDIWLDYSLMLGSQASPSALSIIPVGPRSRSNYDSEGDGWTKVSLLKTESEVPAEIGVRVKGPVHIGEEIRLKLSINPVSSEDLRLKTVTVDDIPQQVWNGNLDVWQDLRIERMLVRFLGTLPNGHAFMTSSTSCQPWTTRAWAKAWFGNSNADANPLGGANDFMTIQPSVTNPDCSNASSIPFPVNGTVGIDTPNRDTAPSFDFTITNPGVQGDGQASTSPKKIVTTIPASINVDVQQLGRTCTIGDFNADTCAKSARVGSVKIETPLIRAGLTGDVYLVKRNATSGLPDLGLRVRGAITFTQLGSNRYVGAKNNQIETTFDNIPQVGFSKLIFHIDGGPQGLLRSLSCPTYNKAPALPNFTYNFYAYTGAFRTVTTPMNLTNCFGIQTLKKYKKCLRKKLPIHANYQSRVRVKSATVKIDGKKKATSRKSPFRFDLKIEKLKLKNKKTHSLELKAVYDDGTISKKRVKFKVCK
ncbi:MAG: hypothetical protein JHC98_07780 [Thermoleophilaceae bacterium]|nr:hypothetical protein [Thermoleophilaceae bacterium]